MKFEGVFNTNRRKVNIMTENQDVTVQIREEQLEIAKKMIQTDEVKIYRETSVQQKSFTIPITREELVIEKKTLQHPITVLYL